MVATMPVRWCRLKRTHILIMRLRLFAVKEEKTGLVCQSSASIRHPRFLLFPLFEKGLSKKGEDRSGVSDFILKGAALYAERFVYHSKVLCISTENVKGACYISEIEDYLLPTYCICSPNAASEVQSYRFCHS